MERFPPDAVSRQLVPSINISLAQMRLIFLGTLFRKRERERCSEETSWGAQEETRGREERERKESGDQADHVSFSQIRGRIERRQLSRCSADVQTIAEDRLSL